MNPAFIPGSHVAVLPGKGVYLRREHGAVILRGAVYERLAPLLDGTRTRDAVAAALAETTAPAEVYYAIDQLIARGYVCDFPPEARVAMGFWSALGFDAPAAVARLDATAVTVVAIGRTDAGPIASALSGAGVRIAPDGDLAVVVVDDYLQPELAEINLEAIKSGRPWLLCKPTGRVVWVGPIFRPGTSACWGCLAHRLRRHRPLEAYIQRRTGGSAPPQLPYSALPGTEGIGLDLAALQVAKSLTADRRADLTNDVVTLDLATLTTERHVVVRRPQCAECGHPLQAARAPEPLHLQGHGVYVIAGGGCRTVTADTTLARFSHHISPITGIVGALRKLDVPGDSDASLHVYRAGRNLAIPVDTPGLLRQVLRTRAAGKGVTDSQARASGLCESLERYSGMFAGDEPRVRATCRCLPGRAIHPNASMLYSERQYAAGIAWSLGAPPYAVVPAPFDEDAVIDWSPVWSLTEQTFKYLPTSYCYYAHPELDQVRHNPPDSNGAAAGNTIEEAIVQGFLELVERDAVGLWWYNRIARPGVDLDSVDDPYIAAVRQVYQRLHREVWALDLTTDMNVPTFAAVSRRMDHPEEAIIFGFGAHFDPQTALLRALTEMHQILPAASSSSVSNPQGADATDAIRWWRTATLTSDPYLRPASSTDARRIPAAADAESGDLAGMVERCRSLAEQRGLEMLVLDQTRPDVGLPVVKVVVPGLRHFWPRFAPGRLYDVPVAMGWRTTPTSEDDMNPVPMFL